MEHTTAPVPSTPAADPAQQAYVRTRYEEQFNQLARTALLLGAGAVVSLVPLDFFAVPDRFGAFAVYRVVTATLMLLLYAALRRPLGFPAHVAAALLAGAAVAVMVAFMVRDFGGHRSVYFAGFILIFVFVSAYLPLPPLAGAGITLAVYAIYLLPILAYDTVRDLPFFLAANVLMVACAAAMLLLQHITYRRMLAEYALRHQVERHRSRLEERVRERTAALEKKVGELEQVSAEVRRLNATLEGRVSERTALLLAANRDLESFSYSISHDLRSPLRAIHGFASILAAEHGGRLDGEGKRCLDRIRAGAARMDALVDELLAFSRLGRQPVQRRTVEPSLIVAAVLEELRAAEPGRAITVAVGDLPACSADPAMLGVVYANLLSNAFKYTSRRPDARVEVGFSAHDGAGAYFVRDNGAGFDMRYADKLFGVFQRLHRAEEYEGTGVGLALVRTIVEKHDGRVWAQAAPGEGATFSFTVGRGPALEA